MRLTPEVLLEILAIFQNGLLGKIDASQGLRELDLEPTAGGELKLTEEYLATHPRTTYADIEDDTTVN